MSLLLMSTDPPPSRGSSPMSWFKDSTTIFRRNSKSPQPEQRPATANSAGLLSVPLEQTRSRSSSTSRSIRSITSISPGKWIKHLNSRSRSPSIVSATNEEDQPLTLAKFKKIKGGWFDAFNAYNRLITYQVSVDPNFSTEELLKIQKCLSDLNDGRFISDLPEALFDVALLWCPAGDMTRKSTVAGELPEPSWSWRGWNGAVNFPFDPSSCPDVRGKGQPAIFFKSIIMSFFLGPELESGMYNIRNREAKLGQEPRIEHLLSLRLSGQNPPTDQADTLRFTAWQVSATAFTMEQAYDEEGDKQPLLCTGLIDAQDRPCGVVMDYKKNIDIHQQGQLHYILLSISRRVPSSLRTKGSNITHPSGTPIWRNGAFVKNIEFKDPPDYETGEWKMYNVMLIQDFSEEITRDGTVERVTCSRRVGVGRIHEDAWNAANPTSERIVLR